MLGSCSIVFAEVFQGAKDSELKITEDFLNSLHDFSMTRETGKLAGKWLREYRKKGVTLSLPDVLIAATAKLHEAVLVTSNVRHFPMKDVSVMRG